MSDILSVEELSKARSRYKNRKKTIRRSYQSGAIDAEERQRRTDAARDAYYLAIGQEPSWHVRERQKSLAEAREFLRGSAPSAKTAMALVQQGDCNEECVAARGLYCTCGCLGVNHGAANGTQPHQVMVKGMTISERIDAGVLDAYEVAQHRLAAAGMR